MKKFLLFIFAFLPMFASFAKVDVDSLLEKIKQNPDYIELISEAQKGDPIASKKIGDLYYEGDGILSFPTYALYWYEKAGDQGDLTAQIKAGDIYSTGVRKNYFLAAKWYEKAANQGNVRALLSLGDIYSTEGNFLIKNKIKAKEYYKKACDLGSLVGCNLYKSI